jgi:hypothetical protein
MEHRVLPLALATAVLLVTACSEDPATQADTTVADATPDTATTDLTDPEVTPDTTIDTTPGACEVASDCPNPLDLCQNATCTPQIPCISDKQCSDLGYVCDQQAGICVLCLADTDCTGEQKCLAQTCVDPPGTCGTSKDCPTGQLCDKTQSVCVGCLADNDCSPLQYCLQTVCKPDLCHGNETTCADNATRKVCTPNGSGWTPEPCGKGTTCLNGACATLLCPPGTLSCVEGQNTVQTCNATGTAWDATLPCTAGNACKDGACVPQVCVPGEKKCNAQGSLDQCTADGLELTTWYCPQTEEGKPQTCGVQNGVATCMSQACAPNSVYCDGSKAMKCDDKGLTAAQTADCSLPGAGGAAQLCLDGACAPAACKAGDKACADPTTLASCNAQGNGYDKTACPQDNACETGACKPVVCAAGQVSCDGGKAMKCSAGGTLNVVIDDCAAKAKACVQGACVAKVCAPDVIQCQGGQLGKCKADGTGWTLTACPQGETCSGGKCTSKLCEPSTQGCNGAVVAACNGSGTAWVTIDDCPKVGKTCEAGACVEVQSGYTVRSGFSAVGDNASGGFRVLDQGFVIGRVCGGGFCAVSGFGL